MRVLVFFRSSVLHDSGTPLRCRNLVKFLAAEAGIELLLLSRDDSEVVQAAMPITHVKLTNQVSLSKQLQSAIDDFSPEIIYGQTHKSMEVLVQAANGLHNRPKLVVDLHGHLAAERLEREDNLRFRRWYWYGRTLLNERMYMPQIDAFTAVSQNLAQRVCQLGKSSLVLWGGVDLDKFHPATVPSANGRIHVTYAGNYRPYQGVSILLQAANRLVTAGEPFHFTFVGDIASFPAQAALARSLGDRVTLPGVVPFADIPSWLGQADILVTPRADGGAARYNYPSKLSEQLAMGKAVIVTDVGEAGQLAQHGKTALVIPPNSVDDMMQALLRLKDESLRQQLGQTARAFAEENLAWPVLAHKLTTFFQKLRADTVAA